VGPVVLPAGPDPLLRFIQLNLLASVASVGLLVGIWLGVVRSGWLLLLVAAIAWVAAVLAYARTQVRAGRRARAVVCTAGASLVVTPVVVAIVPEMLAPLALVVLLQVVLATDFVSERQFARVIGASFVTLLVTAALGRTEGARDLVDEVPDLMVDVVVVIAVPAVGALVALLVWQHRTRLADQTWELRLSRSRLTTAADRERRRLERDLHDGAQQQLVAATVQLPAIKSLVQQGRVDEAGQAVDRVEQRLRGAIDDLRRLARGLYPPVLASRGLADALDEVAATLANPVVTKLGPVPRLAPEVETAVYFCCLEALQNASKHAGPDTTLTIELARRGDAVAFAVADDGPGFDPRAVAARAGAGLVNMVDRISAAGGTLSIQAGPGAGTVVAGSVPCSSERQR
jgi:signal transduction histidine kinase